MAKEDRHENAVDPLLGETPELRTQQPRALTMSRAPWSPGARPSSRIPVRSGPSRGAREPGGGGCAGDVRAFFGRAKSRPGGPDDHCVAP